MSEAKQEILDKVAESLKAQGLPVPPAILNKGKLSTEDSLILHVFLDHLYMQVLPNLKQARKELQKYGEEVGDEISTKMVDLYNWISSLEKTLREGYDIFANEVEIVPDLATMKAFKTKLEEELEYALQLSLDQLQKQDNGSNGNSASH